MDGTIAIKGYAYQQGPIKGYCQIAHDAAACGGCEWQGCKLGYVRVLRRCLGYIGHEECHGTRLNGLFNKGRTMPHRQRVTKPLRSEGPVFGVTRRNRGTPPTV